ncbi:MAG: hypothetical protein KJ915_02055 [Candidatus Omnitrophica bacterium]|nr:hypothetical protein [Candidatus Omnitrophota bacterium]
MKKRSQGIKNWLKDEESTLGVYSSVTCKGGNMWKSKVLVTGIMAMLIIMIVSGLGFAVQWPEVLQQIKANQDKFLNDIKDINITQEMTTITPDGDMIVKMTSLQKGKKFRSESIIDMPGMPESMGPMKNTIIFDGKDTWMISSMMGKKKLLPKESLEQQKDKNWWDFISDKATIKGKENVGGRECYVVEIPEQKDAPFNTIWLTEKNLVPMRIQGKGSKKEIIITEFSDYKKIKGDWEMPYKTTTYMNGKLMFTVIVKSLIVNTGITDDKFDAAKVQVEKKGFSMGNMMKDMMKEE